jgi:NADH-quinone oxidoreductase subunit M
VSIPVIAVLLVLPLIGALGVHRASDDATARKIGVFITGLALSLSTGVAIFLHGATSPRLTEIGPLIPGLQARWHVGIDGLSAPFLPLAALVAFLVLFAGPRATMDRRSMVGLLLTLFGTFGAYCAMDLLLFAFFWIATLVPGALQLRAEAATDAKARVSRTYFVFLVLGSIPMLAAAVLIGYARARAGDPTPFDLGPGAAPIARSYQTGAFVLLGITVLVRKAVFPFHSWLPVLVEDGPIGVAALIVATHLGAFLLLRVAFPLLPVAVAALMPHVAGLALASALLASFVALSQKRLRRALGFVLTSQMGLVVVGLAGGRADSVQGAMLHMLGVGLTGSGLLVVAAAIEARTGTDDTTHLAGLVERFPRMAAAFLLLGVATIGMPGTLLYVAEDLLLHGLLEHHVVLATLLLLVTVMNGINLLRLFFTLFFGPMRRETPIGRGVTDLRPREAYALFALVALVFLGGLAPQPLLELRSRAVSALVAP